MSLQPGIHLGSYEVLAQIGSGGMGEVYRARDAKLDRLVAIKILPPALAGNPDFLARFQREAKAVAALNHPNLVGIYDFNQDGGHVYAVMELLEGETLADLLARGPLTPRRTIALAAQIAQGLAAAHDKGIVHRDLKPSNLWITREGRIKILDFGLAKQQGPAPPADPANPATEALGPLTELGMVLGTAGYMSPEQVRGEPADPRSDIFSFGVVLYEMLTGQRAFKGETPIQTMNAILEHDPEELRVAKGHLPPALERLVLHCLEKHPGSRFQSMRDLAYDLGNLSSLTEASGGFLTPFAARNRSVSRRWAAVGLLLAGVAVWGGWAAHRPRAGHVVYTPLTFTAAPVWNARFSRDGSSVVFTRGSLVAKDNSIYSIAIDNPLPHAVLGPDGAMAALSRNNELASLTGLDNAQGRSESFVGTLGRGPLGAKPRAISPKVVSADWAPDGSGLAVVRDLGTAGMQVEYPEGKVLARMEGGWFSHLRFSPDGARLGVCAHPVFGDDMGSVMVLDARTGDRKELSGPWEAVRGLVWTRDGREIWFTAGNTPNRELMAVGLDRRARNLASAPTDLNLEDLADDGRALVISGDTMLRVFSYELGAREPVDLTLRNYSIIRGQSPDGRLVVVDDETSAGSPPYPLFLCTGDAMPMPLGLGLGALPTADGRKLFIVRGQPKAPKGFMMTLENGMEEPCPMDGLTFQNQPMAMTAQGDVLLLQTPGTGPGRIWRIAPGQAPAPVGPPLPPEVLGFLVSDPAGHRALLALPKNTFAWIDLGDPKDVPHPVPGLGKDDILVGAAPDGVSLYVTRDGALPATVVRFNYLTGRREPFRRVEVPGVFARTGQGSLSADGKRWVGLNRHLTAQLFLVEGLK